MKRVFLVGCLLGTSLLLVACGKADKSVEIGDNSLVNGKKICEEKGGSAQIWSEGGEDVDICLFPDASYCLVESLEDETCAAGFLMGNTNAEVAKIETDMEKCDKMEKDIVCGKDGNTYFNRCYLEVSGVAEETESAHVENGECIYN